MKTHILDVKSDWAGVRKTRKKKRFWVKKKKRNKEPFCLIIWSQQVAFCVERK